MAEGKRRQGLEVTPSLEYKEHLFEDRAESWDFGFSIRGSGYYLAVKRNEVLCLLQHG